MRSLPISHLYLAFFAIVMMGYMALDKGFAYIGVNPFFIGEMTLGLGLVLMLVGAYSYQVFRSPLAWAVILFMVWNALRTLPYVDVYGIDALRDGVLWGYALFALVFSGILLKANKVEAVPDLFARIFPGVLVIGMIGFLITEIVGDGLPTWPGTDATLILVKASDLGVHVAGALAFLALGLYKVFPRKRIFRIPSSELFSWAIVAICSLVVLSRSRGGFAGIASTGLFVTAYRPYNRMIRMAAPILVIGMLFFAFDINIPLGGGRNLSPQQVVTNLLSVFSEQDRDRLDTTEEWRLKWWGLIIDDVVFGDKFWLGRGYGVSHADVDGFADAAHNRSPHSVHINILGRAGVPGAILWIGVLLTLYITLTRCYLRAMAEGRKELAAINLWVMAYSVPFLIAGAFDVYLEGPQGGIPFWCLIGFAIALSESQRPRPSMPAPPSPPPQRGGARRTTRRPVPGRRPSLA